LPPPPSPTLFPYTTLFRSSHTGTRRWRLRLASPAKWRPLKQELSAPAGKIVSFVRSRFWYHDGPRVLSIPEPTITWRLTLYKDCTLCAELTSSSTRIVGCLVGINAGIGQNGIIQLRTSGHRRSQLSSGIDSLRLH